MTISLLRESGHCQSKNITNLPQPQKQNGSKPSVTEQKSTFGINQKLKKPQNHPKQPLRSLGK